MNQFRLILIALVLLALGFLIQVFVNVKPQPQKNQTNSQPNEASGSAGGLPLERADERVTKKPFGIFITRQDSPIQPEKFSGYHTGVDYEIFDDEKEKDVDFNAICDGKILQERYASGYGGILIQSCIFDNQQTTVVYGHVSLKSIAKSAGEYLVKDEQIGILGQPPSETDGERKHLHLGIHKGTGVDIRGYVQNQSELSEWLDFQKLLQ